MMYSGSAIRYTKLVLRLTTYAALFIYLWGTLIFCLPTWTWEYRGTPQPKWDKWRTRNTIKYRMDGEDNDHNHDLIYGWDLQVVLLWWFPIVIAAILTYVVALMPADPEPPKPDRSAHSIASRVKRALSWQLYPRKFWLYWCDGLTVAEFGGVCLWILLHCVGMWNFIVYYRVGTKHRSEIGWGTMVPRSVMYLEWISYSFAWLSFIDFAFLFLPLSRNGFLPLLTGLPYSSLIRYHRWIGHSAMWMVALHGIFFYFYWIAHPYLNFWEEFFDFGKKYYINVLAGSIAFLFGLMLWVTSLNFVRRNFFEVFYKAHLVGFLGFITFAIMHYGWMWSIFVPGLALYAADYAVRIAQGAAVVTVEASYVSDQKNVAVIDLPATKGFSPCPVQDIFLLFPSISRWQWHPFTIMARKEGTDPGQPGSVTVAMKSYGSWTKEALHQLSHSQHPIPIRVNGAFDGFSVKEFRGCDHLLMLGGGIGATPLIAVLTELMRLKACYHTAVAHIQRVKFVWVARTIEELSILPEEVVKMSSSEPWLSLHLYYTGKEPIDAKSGVKVADVKQLPDDADSTSASSSTALGNVCPVSTSEGTYKFRHASPFFWNTARPMESYGHLLSLLTVVAAFVGAFLGLILAMTASVEWLEKHYTTSAYWKHNMMLLAILTIYMIGLPMTVVVLPRYLFFRSKTVCKVNEAGPKCIDHAKVQADGRIGYLESDLSSAVISGRPDIPAILRDMVDNGKAEQVCVYCAGPEALLNSTALTVWDLNDNRPAGQPYIDFKKYSYEL